MSIAPDTGGTSLMLALAGPISAAGAWWAAVGQPGLGLVAARDMGAEIERMALVPDPGQAPLTIVDALADGFGLVSWTPTERVPERMARRLMTRMRQRGTVLLVHGGPAGWPLADVRLRTEVIRWGGLGDGVGRLRWREMAIESRSNAWPRPRRVVVRLPDGYGRLSAAVDGAGTLGTGGTAVAEAR